MFRFVGICGFEHQIQNYKKLSSTYIDREAQLAMHQRLRTKDPFCEHLHLQLSSCKPSNEAHDPYKHVSLVSNRRLENLRGVVLLQEYMPLTKTKTLDTSFNPHGWIQHTVRPSLESTAGIRAKVTFSMQSQTRYHIQSVNRNKIHFYRRSVVHSALTHAHSASAGFSLITTSPSIYAPSRQDTTPLADITNPL
ncbi:hypothetical protein P171DRAFT_490210 [Karstenula rhodostoma CBS 690.94]|uniref:Uncharacterized protein n=1 Tax=Karstenula rhodostoma CBS 690.94 TaxID=1392251 RepID=A0A9P4P946_9PLEO|nr:hypothetical protein P171DRAFT_490210 [Karstenula rhodostoma CBS 690.94]